MSVTRYFGTFNGHSLYGENIYSYYQNKEIEEIVIVQQVEEIRGITLVLKDLGGFPLYTFSNVGGNFPVGKIQFNHSSNRGCDQAEFELLIDVEELGFSLEPGTSYVEFYFFRSTKPFWSGEIISTPSETGEKKKYSYKAKGFSHRLEKIIVDREISEDTEISEFVKDLVQNEIMSGVSQIIYNEELIVDTGQTINEIKFEKQTAKEVMQKLCDIASNYYYGVNEEREFFFRPVNLDINQNLIFFIGGNITKCEIEKTNFDKIVNRYYVYVENETDDGTYIYNGTYNHITSQVLYGLREEELSLPESVNQDIIDEYAATLLNYNAIPQNSAKLSGINALSFSSDLITPFDGATRIFSNRKWILEDILSFKIGDNWEASDNISLVLQENQMHKSGGCVKVSSSDSFGEEIAFTFPNEAEDWSSKKELSFWIYSSIRGNIFDVGIGDEETGYTYSKVYISNENRWQKIIVNIQKHINTENIEKIVFQSKTNDSFTAYIDEAKLYYYGVKIYELETTNVTYSFQTDSMTIALECGMPEKPFVDQFIKLSRKINALDAINNQQE